MALATTFTRGKRTYTILNRIGNLIWMQVTTLGVRGKRYQIGPPNNPGQTESWPVDGKAKRISHYESKKVSKEVFENRTSVR